MDNLNSSELGCEVGFVCGRCGTDHPSGTLCADLAQSARPTPAEACLVNPTMHCLFADCKHWHDGLCLGPAVDASGNNRY